MCSARDAAKRTHPAAPKVASAFSLRFREILSRRGSASPDNYSADNPHIEELAQGLPADEHRARLQSKAILDFLSTG